MSTGLDFQPRAVCGRCERPARVCLCPHIRAVTTRTRVVILQHPRESDVPINTARLAGLSLSSVERHVGVEFRAHAAVRAALANPAAPAILLFPEGAARDLTLEPPDGAVTLVVIDGTWFQAEKIFKRNPELHALPRYRLNPTEPSRYRIRKEPAPDYMSTIEAIVGALSVLEAPDVCVRGALEPFEALVEQQLGFKRESRERRHAAKPKTARTRRAPRVLAERASDLVAGYGEANAWPRGSALGPHPELVHWAAERVQTGERFEAFIAPRRELSPSFGSHNGLSRERVLAGEPWDSFLERWRAFLGPTALVASWGFYAAELLRSAGGLPSDHLDARSVALRYLGAKPGDVLGCARALGASPEPAWVSGRTGARLAALSSVLRVLLAVGSAEPEREPRR